MPRATMNTKDTFDGIKAPIGQVIVCVYKLIHVATGYFYIGSTGNYKLRRKSHITALRGGKHNVQKMQELYDESPHFKFEIDSVGFDVEDPEVREKAFAREQELLDINSDNPLLLNKSSNAKAIVLSGEHEKKRIEKIKATHQKPEVLARMTDINRSTRQSDEAREQQSEISKTMWTDPNHRATMEAHWKDPEYLRKQTENQPTSKAIVAAGKAFGSIQSAAKALGIGRNLVKKRIKDSAYADYYMAE